MDAIIITKEEAIRMGFTTKRNDPITPGKNEIQYIQGIVCAPNENDKTKKGKILEIFRVKKEEKQKIEEISNVKDFKVKETRGLKINREIIFQDDNYRKSREKKGLDRDIKWVKEIDYTDFFELIEIDESIELIISG